MNIFPNHTLQKAFRFKMSAGDPLPEGHYALLDYYCPNPDCDCQIVTLEVVALHQKTYSSKITEHSLAAFDYELNNPISADNLRLQENYPKTVLTDKIIEFFSALLKKNPKYNQEMNKRYHRCKNESQKLREVLKPQIPMRREKSIARNEPCACGVVVARNLKNVA